MWDTVVSLRENICYVLMVWARKVTTVLKKVVAKNVLIGITGPKKDQVGKGVG